MYQKSAAMYRRRRRTAVVYLPIAMISLASLGPAAGESRRDAPSERSAEPVRALLEPDRPRYDPKHVLVGFERGTSSAERRATHRLVGTQYVNTLAPLAIDVVRAPRPAEVPDLLRRYLTIDGVAFAERNGYATIGSLPNDTYWPGTGTAESNDTWPLHNLAQWTGVADGDIDAPEGWALTGAASGSPWPTAPYAVGIVDTGVATHHPDLADKVIQPCFRALSYTGVLEAGCEDDMGHGTHVSGTVAAVANNGIGIAGVAFNARVYMCKALSYAGSGAFADIAACINDMVARAAEHDIRVINLSLGSFFESDTMRAAVDNAWSNQVLVVAASGNNGCDCNIIPASYESAVSVGATMRTDEIAPFSNYGPKVELSAPGTNVLSTVPEHGLLGSPTGYATLIGTSMAAPHAAGVAAMLSWRTGKRGQELRDAMQLAVDDLGDPGRDDYYGYGRVNLCKALGGDCGYTPSQTDGGPPGAPIFTAPTVAVSVPSPVSLRGSTEIGTEVEIFVGGSPVRTVPVDTYGDWAVDLTLGQGTHTVTAAATDDAGNVSDRSQGLVLRVDPDAVAPFVARGATERTHITHDGRPPTEQAYIPSLSSDGRFVAFTSRATNLVPGYDVHPNTGAVYVRDRASGRTEIVSVSTGGELADGGSGHPVISADGRYVAFGSRAGNLAPGDEGNTHDVFLRDRTLGVTKRISEGVGGEEPNGESYDPAMSADGRFIVFPSIASNLVTLPPDLNEGVDYFLFDQQTARMEMVSVTDQGLASNNRFGLAFKASVSADGRYVAFQSGATNLVLGDSNDFCGYNHDEPCEDIVVRDRVTGRNEFASVATGGEQVRGDAFYPSISADGRYVSFATFATNLVANDFNFAQDNFIHDRVTGRTQRVNVSSHGGQAYYHGAYAGLYRIIPPLTTLSADGRYVAFYNISPDIVPENDNQAEDVFLRDLHTGATERVSGRLDMSRPVLGKSQGGWVSADGGHVGFASMADLAPGIKGVHDTYVRDRTATSSVTSVAPDERSVTVTGEVPAPDAVLTTATDPSADGSIDPALDLVSVTMSVRYSEADLHLDWQVRHLDRTDLDANVVAMRFSVDGRRYEVRGAPLSRLSPAGGAAFRLYRCDTGCIDLGAVTGSYGTVTDGAKASVPLQLLGNGGSLSNVQALTGRGTIEDMGAATDSVGLGNGRITAAPDVFVGVAPSGTASDAVTFERAAVRRGNFSDTASTAGLPLGTSRAWTKICSSGRCRSTSVPFEITVDRVAPDRPQIIRPRAGEAFTTTRIAFAGTAEPSSLVKLLRSGAEIGSTRADDAGAWQTTVSIPMGDHVVEVVAVDAAGNVGQPSTVGFAVTVGGPAARITAGPTGAVREASATFTFTASDASTFECSLDGAPFAGCSSPRSIASLSEGRHTFSVRAFDSGGNVGVHDERVWVVDTVTPTPPAILSPLEGAELSDSFVIFGGTSEAGVRIALHAGQGMLGTTTADATGRWAMAAGLPNGTHAITGTATDAAGNTSLPSAARGLIVADTSAPAAPTIDSPAQGAIMDPSMPVVDGTAEPGSRVTLREGAGSLGTVVVNAAGRWRHALWGIAAGSHTIAATAADAAGNVGVSSPTRTFSVYRSGPPPLTITSPGADSISPQDVVFTGTGGRQGSAIVLREGDAFAGSVMPAADGSWIMGLRLPGGAHRMVATSEGIPPSIPVSFTVDGQAPIVSIATADRTVFVPGKPAVIAGHADDDLSVVSITVTYYDIFRNQVARHEASCGCGSGARGVSWTSAPSLPSGHYTAVVHAVDEAGNVSAVRMTTFVNV